MFYSLEEATALRPTEMESLSFRWKAQVWEEEDRYDSKVDMRILPQERRFIDQCFSEERTRQWSTRMGDYWEEYGTRLGPLADAFRRKNNFLPDGREPGSLHQKFDAVGLSSLLKKCRKARVGTEFHGFMHLPPELRCMVYRHALVADSRFVIASSKYQNSLTDKVFDDYNGLIYQRFLDNDASRPLRGRGPRRIFEHRSPTSLLGRMNLLMGVSRTIHAECSQLFFSQNQLIFSTGKCMYPLGFERPRQGTYWLDYASLARDVSFTFDMRDQYMDDNCNLHKGELIDKSEIDEGSLPPGEALLRLHNQKTMDLELAWVDRIDAIKTMTLDRIQLSFEECYCAIGCCRKVGWILDGFIHKDLPPGRTEDEIYCNTDWKDRSPLVIEVLGWRSEKEKTMIEEKLGQLRSRGTTDIRLIEDDPDRF